LSALGKSAAIATIVAATFTIAAYFNETQPVIIERILEVNNPDYSSASIIKPKVEEASTSPIISSYAKPEISATVENSSKAESSIKVRHKIALTIPGQLHKTACLKS